MNNEDIKLMVLTTMADASTTPAERHHLMQKVELLRYDRQARFKRTQQFLLALLTVCLAAAPMSGSFQPFVPLLASLRPERDPAVVAFPPFDPTPFAEPNRKHIP